MKYLSKFWALFAVLLFAISLSSCQNEDNVSNTNSETELSVGYSVGSTVMFENANYYVVSNTIDSAVNNNSSRAVTEDISSLVKTYSVERATYYATKYFGENILLLRTSGKVTVPNGATASYKETYDTIQKGLSENEKMSDYFSELKETTKNEVDYADIYVILNSAKEQIGTCRVNWNSDLNKTFDDNKSLFDLIRDFSPEMIRKVNPAQYTINKHDKTLKCNYQVMDNKLEEDGRYRLLENARDSLYVTNKRIVRAATLANEWDADGNWIRSYIAPSAVFGNSTMTAGITYNTIRYQKGEFYYQIRGSSKITDSSSLYDSGTIKFKFDENKKFVADNITIPANSGLYSADADLEYDEKTLSVPVEFILNDDGSVSFGPSVYAWVKNWRDYIISNHDEADVYEE